MPRVPLANLAIAPIFLSALLVTACQPQEGRVNLKSDEKIIVSSGTWDDFQEYLQTINGGKRGAFVVSEDGSYATYSYCQVIQGCYYSINYSASAMKSCTSEGYKCVVFAKDDEIIVPYDIAE